MKRNLAALLLAFGLCLCHLAPAGAAGAKTSLAVIVVKSPSLSESEQVSLANIIGKGFADTGRYRVVDPDTVNRMLEDEVAEALLLGNENKLDEIQRKYQVDILVNVSAQLEASSSVGAYAMASSSVTIACRRKSSEELFDQKTSEPQNGYYGMPEWLGSTAEAARQVALLAAVADIFRQIEFDTVAMPLPIKPAIVLQLEKVAPAESRFLERQELTAAEAEQLVQLAADSIGSKNRITARALDQGKRIAAVGILNQDLDLQRHRRLDTAEFQVFDFRKQRRITAFQLPREIEGVRRPRSREIVDFAFAPSGRFMVIASKHPVLWVYDVLSGAMLTSKVLEATPTAVSLSENGRYIQVSSGRRQSVYQIVSHQAK